GSTAAGGADGTGGAQANDKRGSVHFFELYTGTNFLPVFFNGTGIGCTRTPHGGCAVSECAGAVAAPRVSAGTVSYENAELGVVQAAPHEENSCSTNRRRPRAT